MLTVWLKIDDKVNSLFSGKKTLKPFLKNYAICQTHSDSGEKPFLLIWVKCSIQIEDFMVSSSPSTSAQCFCRKGYKMRLAGSQFLHKLGFCIKCVCFGHFFFNLTYSNPHYFHKSFWMLSGLHAEGCKPGQPQEKMHLLLSHLLSATAQGLLLSNSKELPIIATLYKCTWRAWV